MVDSRTQPILHLSKQQGNAAKRQLPANLSAKLISTNTGDERRLSQLTVARVARGHDLDGGGLGANALLEGREVQELLLEHKVFRHLLCERPQPLGVHRPVFQVAGGEAALGVRGHRFRLVTRALVARGSASTPLAVQSRSAKRSL